MYDKGNIRVIGAPGSGSISTNSKLNIMESSVAERGEQSYVAKPGDALFDKKERVDDVIFATAKRHQGVFSARVSYLNNISNNTQDSEVTKVANLLTSLKIGDIVHLEALYGPAPRNISNFVRANIVGKDEDGYTLIKTAIGIFSTEVELGVDIGMDVLLKIRPSKQADDISGSVSTSYAEQSKNSKLLINTLFKQIYGDIGLLQEMVSLFYASEDDKKRYRNLTQIMLSRSSNKVIDNVLRNSRVVDPERVERWIDDEIITPVTNSKAHNPVRVLEDVVERARSIFLDESVHSSWRTIVIPVTTNQERKMHRIFVRGKSSPGHFIRFITEIELYNAPLQIDGLVHFSSAGSNITHVDHFLLTLRSAVNLPNQFTKNISQIFLAHQRISGIKGLINFEENAEFADNPEQEIQNTAQKGDAYVAKYV